VTTFEFGSSDWFDAVEQVFLDIVAAAPTDELAGVNYTFAETYTGVPEHLSATGRLSWHVRLADGAVHFVREEPAQADIQIVSDYSTVLPFAATPFDGAGPPPHVMQVLVKAMADGAFQMTNNGTTPPPAFGGVHDAIAAITTAPPVDPASLEPPFDPTSVLAADLLDLSPYAEEMEPFNRLYADMQAGDNARPEQPGGILALRKMLEGGLFGAAGGDEPEIRTIDGPRGPIPVRVFVADEVNALYLDIHGGGWAFGAASMDDGDNLRRASAAGVAVFSVEYRLAPEYHHPAGLDDCVTVARWLLEHGPEEFGVDQLFIGGGSAGAHLAALTVLALRDSGCDMNRIAGVNLAVGAYDLTGTPSQRSANGGVAGTWTSSKVLPKLLCPHLDAEEFYRPDVSPLYADLRGLPPALFTAAGLDALRDDSIFMAALWEAAGNEADLVVFPNCPHIFGGLPTKMSAIAQARMDAFVRDHIRATAASSGH